MWWCWLAAAWLLAVAAISRGGVPPAPLHVGPYQRRLAYDQSQQQQQQATLEELFREQGPQQDDWGPPDQPTMKRNEGLQAAQALASQHMLRTPRGSRQYDVPQIECPPAQDGMERFACPSPDHQGRYRCIDDHVLCDGFIDCPNGEDEDRRACMFYKTTKAHLDVLADALLRWARGR